MNLAVNDILFTKDGRTIGNALVTKVEYSERLKENAYHIITDYGNQSVFTEREILEWFHPVPMPADKDHKYYVSDKKILNDRT